MSLNNMGKKKSQSSIEFFILIGAIFFFFLTFLLAIQYNIADKTKANIDLALKEVALTIQNEINIAAASQDGYFRGFDLPSTIANLDYTVLIDPGIVYVNTVNGLHAIALPVAPNVIGVPLKGDNTAAKEIGRVCLNVRDDICGHECDDGIDNDGDGLIDCQDGGCREIPGNLFTPCLPGEDEGGETPQCMNGFDDDGDDPPLIDFDGGPNGEDPDPDCDSPEDISEFGDAGDQFEDCGDGVIDPGETCDDGCGGIWSDGDYWDFVGREPPACDDLPPSDGDGCSAICQIEYGWHCAGGVCNFPDPTDCNDGIDNDGDTLIDFDGGLLGGDPDPGCEDLSDTSEINQVPEASTCGNGVLDIGEECDDGCEEGNPQSCDPPDNGDGCDTSCDIEDGYWCYGDFCNIPIDISQCVDQLDNDDDGDCDWDGPPPPDIEQCSGQPDDECIAPVVNDEDEGNAWV